jgi:hypothetical protein
LWWIIRSPTTPAKIITRDHWLKDLTPKNNRLGQTSCTTTLLLQLTPSTPSTYLFNFINFLHTNKQQLVAVSPATVKTPPATSLAHNNPKKRTSAITMVKWNQEKDLKVRSPLGLPVTST